MVKGTDRRGSPVAHADRERDRWWLVVAAGLAVFMASVDMSIVNVALPAIERNFSTRLESPANTTSFHMVRPMHSALWATLPWCWSCSNSVRMCARFRHMSCTPVVAPGPRRALVALAALGMPMACIGIDVDAQTERVMADVRRVGREAAVLLGTEETLADGLVEIIGGYAGPAYGVPDASTLEAIDLAARLEALALDPVYSGKGMAGLIGLVRAGRFRRDDVILWIHTGGVPGLFAYPTAMATAAARSQPALREPGLTGGRSAI